MPPHLCSSCHTARAQVLRPKTLSRVCAPCFTSAFENETLATIKSHSLFRPGERVAIGASGGKDSCVLAAVLHTLNTRHSLGLDLVLLSIDEGITGYRDHSLDAVRRNAQALGLPLEILSYKELYGWSMDQVVAQIGKKGNCTYCGVFRRQALDRGAAKLGVRHVVTGHNADDVAETVIMNLLRGDLARLGRATSIITSTPGEVIKSERVDKGMEKVEVTDVKRSKPLMYAYEKEIVLYAHHKKLDYFSTECIYSPEAFRGSARTLIKNLERIRPESILDIVKSGIDMASMVPDADGNCGGKCSGQDMTVNKAAIISEEEETAGGCNDAHGADGGAGMVVLEKKLEEQDRREAERDMTDRLIKGSAPGLLSDTVRSSQQSSSTNSTQEMAIQTVPIRPKQKMSTKTTSTLKDDRKLGKCETCGYLSSQKVCKACVLLEGLNKARPKLPIAVEIEG